MYDIMETNLTTTNQSKEIKLTPKNRVFLEYITEGCSIPEAYSKAGYKGNKHASYALYSTVKHEFAKILEAKGYSREGLANEILGLVKRPIALDNGTVTINQKIRLLSLMLNALRLENESKASKDSHVTNFIINRSSQDGKSTVRFNSPIEAQVVPNPQSEVSEPKIES